MTSADAVTGDDRDPMGANWRLDFGGQLDLLAIAMGPSSPRGASTGMSEMSRDYAALQTVRQAVQGAKKVAAVGTQPPQYSHRPRRTVGL